VRYEIDKSRPDRASSDAKLAAGTLVFICMLMYDKKFVKC